MIIVSQDKTEIINFDNVNTLRATKTGFIVSYENTYKAEDDCSNILGKYKTESRAKEVLKTFYEYYSRLNYKDEITFEKGLLTILKVKNGLFVMPEE